MTGPTLELLAPAKINWTLEVLGKRPDGYHDVRTILQSIALSDSLAARPADGLSLELSGEAGPLAAEPPDRNLAYRAAARLQREAGRPLGARIDLRKDIPIAAGFGGGSSDAAAVLRGLRELWGMPVSDDELASIAADLGSDVPFFLLGGTVLAAGKGDKLASLPDVAPRRLVVAWPERGRQTDKTARMYAALRPEHFTDGSRSERLAARLRVGELIRDEEASFGRTYPLPSLLGTSPSVKANVRQRT
jgi:4-diphosphocytidyl-2-C-methyl-D-erythritol kinase